MPNYDDNYDFCGVVSAPPTRDLAADLDAMRAFFTAEIKKLRYDISMLQVRHSSYPAPRVVPVLPPDCAPPISNAAFKR